MTVSTNTDCAGLTVTSDLITDFILGDPDPVTLSISNCDTSYEVEVDEDPLIILPEDLGAIDTIPDGVYSLVLTKTSDDGITREFLCHFVNCALTCDLQQFVLDNIEKDSSKVHETFLALQALEYMNQCSEVDCTDFCEIYKALTTNLSTNDCGC